MADRVALIVSRETLQRLIYCTRFFNQNCLKGKNHFCLIIQRFNAGYFFTNIFWGDKYYICLWHLMLTLIRNLLIAVALITIGITMAEGQTITRSSVDSQGETVTAGGVTLSYVIGEAIGDLLSNTAANKYLTAGFLQPDVEISQVLANNAKALALYPNPTNGGSVKLAFNNVPDGTYTINLYDAAGKLLQTQSVNYSKTDYYFFPLDVSKYKGGTYFIQVVNPVKFQGEVKLIKY